MAQSGCSAAPPAAAAGQDAAWAAKNRNRKQRKSSHVYHIYMYMLHSIYIASNPGTSAAIFAIDNALESNSNLMRC